MVFRLESKTRTHTHTEIDFHKSDLNNRFDIRLRFKMCVSAVKIRFPTASCLWACMAYIWFAFHSVPLNPQFKEKSTRTFKATQLTLFFLQMIISVEDLGKTSMPSKDFFLMNMEVKYCTYITQWGWSFMHVCH